MVCTSPHWKNITSACPTLVLGWLVGSGAWFIQLLNSINLSHLIALATFYDCCLDLSFHQRWKIVTFISATALIHSEFLIEWNFPFQPFGHLEIQFTSGKEDTPTINLGIAEWWISFLAYSKGEQQVFFFYLMCFNPLKSLFFLMMKLSYLCPVEVSSLCFTHDYMTPPLITSLLLGRTSYPGLINYTM